jgi:two-component system response regulator YesN
MIRVLIADDEPYFREFMIKVVDWESMGFTITGVARNGLEAYKIVEQNPADVFFLDINMPHTNGLELARMLREKNPQSIVVFVTGYTKFEYAQRALQLGVEEYMLKPFSKEEMISVLIKIRDKFSLRAKEARKQHQDRLIIKNHLFYQFLTSENVPDSVFFKQLKDVGIQFSNGPCRVSLISIDHLQDLKCSGVELDALQYGVENILDEITVINGFHYLVGLPEHMIASVLVFKDEQSAKSFHSTPYQRLVRLSKQMLNLSVLVGVGKQVPQYFSIADSYRSALAAVKNLSLTEKEQVVYADKMEVHMSKFEFYQIQQDEEILNELRSGHYDNIFIKLNQIERDVQACHFSNDFIYSIAFSIVSICSLYLTEIGESKQNVLDELNYYTDITSCKDCHKIFEYLSNLLLKIETYLQGQHENRAEQIVSQVKQFIYEHYHDPSLSVEEIAKHFFITDSYLRRIFAKQQKKTISGCILKVRMQQAKKLLGENYSTGEVAEKVGYKDTGYFGKCFKKYFGITPGSFKKDSF